MLVCSLKAVTVEQFMASLPDPVEEVDKAIIKDFTRLQNFASRDLKELVQDYLRYKKQWTERMIEFLIR
jgi:hypothetical protein